MSKIISMRLDDDLIALIDSYPGSNFSEKFRKLVYFKKNEFDPLEKRFNRIKSEYDRLCIEINKQRALISHLEHLANLVCNEIDKFDY